MSKSIFFHSNTTPRVCVCGVTTQDGNKLVIGAARCSKKNHYVKSIGRKISEGRALKHPIAELEINNDEPFSKRFAQVASSLARRISNRSNLVKTVTNTEELLETEAVIEAEVTNYTTE